MMVMNMAIVTLHSLVLLFPKQQQQIFVVHLDSAESENTSIGSIMAGPAGATGLPGAVIVVLAKVTGVIPPKLLRKFEPAIGLAPAALIVVAVGNMGIVSAPHRWIPLAPTPLATANAKPKFGPVLFCPGLMLPG